MSNALQPGKYLGRAIGGQLREGKNYPYVSVECGANNGGTVWWTGSLSETPFQSPLSGGESCPADVTIRDLLVMGWDGKDINQLTGLGTREAEFVVVAEMGNDGINRSKVKYVNRPGERANAKPVEAGKAKALQASLRGRVIAAQQKMNLPEPETHAQGAVEDDDFPFGYNSNEI